MRKPDWKVGDTVEGATVVKVEENVIRYGAHFPWMVTVVFPRA